MTSKAVIISADNRGPWINIVTWILGVLVCLAALIKLLSKRVRSHTTQYDDGYVVAATVCSSSSIESYPQLEQLTPPTASGAWLRHHTLSTSKGWSRATFIPSEQCASTSLPAGLHRHFAIICSNLTPTEIKRRLMHLKFFMWQRCASPRWPSSSSWSPSHASRHGDAS